MHVHNASAHLIYFKLGQLQLIMRAGGTDAGRNRSVKLQMGKAPVVPSTQALAQRAARVGMRSCSARMQLHAAVPLHFVPPEGASEQEACLWLHAAQLRPQPAQSLRKLNGREQQRSAAQGLEICGFQQRGAHVHL